MSAQQDCTPISVVINTRNAEEHLEEVLKSLEGFSEILVCDMESTDSTLAIAQAYGCRIVTFPASKGNIVEVAREFAIHQAANEWVLVVDADELVTPQLCAELHRLAAQTNHCGFLIPRRNKFLGEYERSFRKDLQLRFFRQSCTHWPAIIHTKPEVMGSLCEVTASDAVLIHLQDRTIADFISAYNTYTDHEIVKRQDKRFGAFSLLWRPFFVSFKYYFLRGGWKNGTRGVLHAAVIGMYDFFMVAKLMESKLDKKQ